MNNTHSFLTTKRRLSGLDRRPFYVALVGRQQCGHFHPTRPEARACPLAQQHAVARSIERMVRAGGPR